MKSKRDSLKLKLAIVMVLLIPIFFSFRVEYVIPLLLQYTFWDIIIILLGSIALLLFGYFITVRAFSREDFGKMRVHDVVNGFISHDYKPIVINFLITMILEELIFRFYIIGILILFLDSTIVILIASGIFSMYHIHIWFFFRNSKILAVYLVFSFLLGVLNGFVLFKLGLIFCILIHYVVVLILYWKIAREVEEL